MKRQVKLQLLVFAIVTVLSAAYGSVKYLGAGDLVNPPYSISADFAGSGGIYPGADVDLLGVRVGKVASVEPGPAGGTIVSMDIIKGRTIPQDVRATVADKSAIGEQFVELTPQRAGNPALPSGGRIPRAQTALPLPVDTLIADLDAFAGSVPKGALTTSLNELAAATDGLATPFGQIIDRSQDLTHKALANERDLIALIDASRTVLDTQASVGPQFNQAVASLAALTTSLRTLDHALPELFVAGLQASTDLTRLLNDTQMTLPVVLDSSLILTDVARNHLPALRKTLVVFPWVVELESTAARYCEHMDAKAGAPDQKTCAYDRAGNPIWKAWLGLQPDQPPNGIAYLSCVRGYEGTHRYQPNGTPVSGSGPEEVQTAQPNLDARCTAPPTDSKTPLVRGAQNVPGQGSGPLSRYAAYDPATGQLATPNGAYIIKGPYGPGSRSLAQLLSSPLQ